MKPLPHLTLENGFRPWAVIKPAMQRRLPSAFPLLLAGLIVLAACAQLQPSRPARIAFMSDRDGQLDVFIMDREGNNPTNLTNAESADGLPIWSRAANSFAFLTDRDGDSLAIYRMDDTGDNTQALTVDPPANAGPPVWSPTGEWIAFGSGIIDPLSGQTTRTDVYLMDRNGENMINLTDSPNIDRFGAWSPDGSRLLFTSDKDGDRAIYLIEVPDGDIIRLTDPTYTSVGPSWSPDGSKITFLTDKDEDIEIYIMDVDGSNLTRLTDSSGVDAYPTWSPDGDRIAFISARDGNAEIYTMNPDGSDTVNLSNNPAQESPQGDLHWSPDGSQILFHTDRDGDIEIYVMNTDGSDQVNLSNNPGNDLGAVWVE